MGQLFNLLQSIEASFETYLISSLYHNQLEQNDLRKSIPVLSVIVFDNVVVMPSVDSDKGNDRIRKLYPLVDEDKTPLPRGWNPKDKGPYIGISQNGRRVSYRGGSLLLFL